MKSKYKWIRIITCIGVLASIGTILTASCSINKYRKSIINKNNFYQASLAYEFVDWHQDFNIANNNLIIENNEQYNAFNKQPSSKVISNPWNGENVSLIQNQNDFNIFFLCFPLVQLHP